MNSLSLSENAATSPEVPRLDSLHHRLLHARDAEGRPIPLLDELLFFLDDPPPDTRDRWEDGADLCRRHGIATSRMSVWRFYRANILRWRREQNPPPEPPSDPGEIARLHDQARHLCAQRVIEVLNDPRLSAGHLIGFLQSDNHRQQNQLARDQFEERLAAQERLQEKERFKGIEDDIRNGQLTAARLKFYREILARSADEPAAIPPDTTS